MKCQQLMLNMEQLLDGDLTTLQQEAMLAHVKTCASCRFALTREEMLRQGLRNLPAVTVNPDFIERATIKAHESHKDIRNYFKPGFAIALAASLAVLFLTTATVMRTTLVTGPGNESFPLIAMSVNETRTVSMVFDSPADFQAVRFHLSLPKGFEVSSYPGQTVLDWNVDLKKGSNILTLPLVALAAGKGDLIASIAHSNKYKSFRLSVSSKIPNQSVL